MKDFYQVLVSDIDREDALKLNPHARALGTTINETAQSAGC
jgi:hypothetical protein